MQNPLSKDELRYAFQGNLKFEVIREFLGSTYDNTCLTIKTYDFAFRKYSICVVLEDFLREKGYKSVRRVDLTEQDYYPLQKQDIQTDSHKNAKCVTDGVLFLDGPIKVILELEESYSKYDSWDLKLYYRNEEEPKALNFLVDLDKYAKEHCYLRGKKISPDLSHIPLDRKYSWDDIVLPTKVKAEIQQNVDNLIKKIDVYRKNNLPMKRGLLLKGVPGTGKTLIGKILCQSVNCTFIWVTPKFLSSSKHVAAVCSLARELSPSILFLEDVDLYGSHRETAGDKSMLGELMNQLDGIVENDFVITIATTNQSDKVEDALRNRPGRFDRIIDVPKPSHESRKKMLELHSKNCECSRVNFDKIADAAEGYTGAHVKELVNTAVIHAVDQNSLDSGDKIVLKDEHFLPYVESVKSKSISPIGFSTGNDDDDDEAPTPEEL